MIRQKSKEFVRVFLFYINEIERIRKNLYKEKILNSDDAHFCWKKIKERLFALLLFV